MKKIADERQSGEMLKIGNICFYFVWYALLASILLQTVVWKADARQIAGELAVFLLGGILMLVLMLTKGLWGFYTRPNRKTYIVASAVAGVVVGGVFALLYDWTQKAAVTRHILWIAVFTAGTFLVCYALLSLAGRLVAKRQAKLDEAFDREE
ncbi:MAG TPA: hypothetical protein P5075_03840 [Eubacteriales bacterium]|nr:hypothetical protein [Eubacteriales bacterium]